MQRVEDDPRGERLTSPCSGGGTSPIYGKIENEKGGLVGSLIVKVSLRSLGSRCG